MTQSKSYQSVLLIEPSVHIGNDKDALTFLVHWKAYNPRLRVGRVIEINSNSL